MKLNKIRLNVTLSIYIIKFSSQKEHKEREKGSTKPKRGSIQKKLVSVTAAQRNTPQIYQDSRIRVSETFGVVLPNILIYHCLQPIFRGPSDTPLEPTRQKV